MTEDEVSAEPLALGDRDEISPGAQVFAIGTALGALTHTFTDGMLSGIRTSGVTEVIQVTSPFSPGMSGGPVLSKDSKVLGVISFTFTEGQNLNIAVAATQVRSLLAEPMRGPLVVAAELKRAADHEQTTAKPSDSKHPPTVDSAQAKAQASADLLSEVMWWGYAAIQGAERIYSDSTSMNDWRQMIDLRDAACRRLPLLTTTDASKGTSLAARLDRSCTLEEFRLLGDKLLAVSAALDDVIRTYGVAIIERHSEAGTKEQLKVKWASASDSSSRASSLIGDFMNTAFTIGGRESVANLLSPKGYGFISAVLGVHYDADRPEIAAVRWRYPFAESEFRVGDVITGMRTRASLDFITIENWKSVGNFLKQAGKASEVVVRVRNGREFIVKLLTGATP